MFYVRALLYSLFSKEFYAIISKSRLKTGLIYLALLSLISSVLFLFSLTTRAVPQSNAFKEWVKAEMPPLVWSPRQGLSMGVPSPYTMTHPELGPVAVFDLDNPVAVPDKYPSISTLVTRSKVYIKNRPGQMRVFDLNELAANVENPAQEIVVTPEVIDAIYNSVKPWILGGVFVLFVPFFFLWKFVVAAIYSVVGIIFNFMRREKLEYPAIFNITLFAMTPVILIQILQGLIPVLGRIPFGFLGGLVVMSGYLYLGIKMSEDPGDFSSEPGSI